MAQTVMVRALASMQAKMAQRKSLPLVVKSALATVRLALRALLPAAATSWEPKTAAAAR